MGRMSKDWLLRGFGRRRRSHECVEVQVDVAVEVADGKPPELKLTARQECDPESRVFQHELHLSEWETCLAARAAIQGLPSGRCELLLDDLLKRLASSEDPPGLAQRRANVLGELVVDAMSADERDRLLVRVLGALTPRKVLGILAKAVGSRRRAARRRA